MSSRRRLSLALTLILVTGLLFPKPTGLLPRADPPLRSPPKALRMPRQSVPARAPKTAAIPAPERVDSEEIWDIELASQPLAITLALDEAVLRDADGKETISRLTPPATQETLPARLAELSAPLGVFPVAYLAARNDPPPPAASSPRTSASNWIPPLRKKSPPATSSSSKTALPTPPAGSS